VGAHKKVGGARPMRPPGSATYGLKCQLMTKLEMMHILQAQVCGCISSHPGFPPVPSPRGA